MAVSCVQEQLAVYDDTKITAPVLGTYNVAEDVITANYTPAKLELGFNENIAPSHTLAVVSLNGEPQSKSLTTTNDGATLTLKTVNLAKALMTLGAKEGSNANVELAVRATLQDVAKDNGVNGYKDSEKHILVSSFLVEIPEVQGNPWEAFTKPSPWSLIGSIASTGNGWNADEPAYMTEDGTKHVVMKIKLAQGDQFKFRKDGGWDVNAGAPGDTEPYVLTVGEGIAATPNGKNLAVPADGFYDVLLDEGEGTITITDAFITYPGFDEVSTWSVIGAIGSVEMEWNKDIQMTTDGTWHVAEGVVLTKGDQFKFRKDCSWDTNIGAAGDVEPFVVTLDDELSGVANGKNLSVPEDGTYDLLVNPDANLIKVVASLGGKSPLVGADTPADDKPQAWSIIGTIGGSSWDNDIDLTNVEGDKWIARLVTVTADDEFKIRADHDWAISYGGPEGNSSSTIDPANAYEVYKPTIGTAFAAGDKNIQIGVAGVYDITLNYSADGSTILIEEHNAAYSLIGEINGDSWTKDIVMTEKDGIWTSPVVNITGGFKIRYDFSWDDANCYGAETDDFVATPGTPFVAVQPGKNIKLAEAGDYKVEFNPATKTVTINTVAYPEHLYMIGAEFGGWDWNSDGVVEMTPVVYQPTWGADSDKSEAQFFAIRYITAGQGFKFCSQRAWSGDFWGLTTNEGFTEASGNCTVDASGVYLIHVDLKREIVHVEPARVYGIGNCFGGWDAAMEGALFQADGKTLKATAKADGELRMYVESSISNSGWWTREFIILDGKIDYRGDDEGQGDQARVNVKNGQEIVLDFNAGTGEIKGEGQESPLPTTMYMIGEQFGNWNWDDAGIAELVPVFGTQGVFWCTRWFDHTKGFKFCAQKAWSGDFTGDGAVGYTVDGGNCFVAQDGFYTVYVNADGNVVEISPAEVYGIGDAWGANAWDFNAEDPVKFTAEGQTMVATVTNNSTAVRLATRVTPSVSVDGCTPNGWFDWWKTEFVYFDGKIAYRGLGGDQERVAVEAGQVITLDFNNGTVAVSGGSTPSDWTSSATDLSTAGTANCYVVSAAGAYKIHAVKGNTATSVGTVAGAEIVWETYNNTTDVTEKSVIAAVAFDAQNVYFKTPDTLKPGNALVAAKDADGKILWSWHIWIPKTAFTTGSYDGLFGSDAMSRNLGALEDAAETGASAESCGLLYQWGRKDPFMGLGEMAANNKVYAKTTGTFSTEGEQQTIASSIQNPTKLTYNGETAVDPDWAGKSWCSEDISTAWGTAEEKGLYDPCPAGYRVPAFDESKPAWTADGWTIDLTHFVYKKGNAVFPYAGYLDDCGCSLSHGGDRSAVWSSTPSDDDRGKSFDVRSSYALKSQHKARGNSVRCVAE